MHYVYDFDSTLYATIRLWNRWVGIIERHGYSTPDLTTVEKTLNETFRVPFTPRRHAEKVVGMEPAHAERAVDEQARDVAALGAALVYSDARAFLERNHGAHRQSLLTFGDRDYQMGKIGASGIGGLVGDVQIAGFERGKAEFLRDLVEAGSEPIVFIDDHPKHLQSAYDAGLPVQLVRMRRPDEPHTPDAHPLDDVAWRVIASLDELS